jgi:hypothetical protein
MSKITIFGDTSGKIELAVANTIPANLTFTLPSADGLAGQVLTTSGDGILSFTSNDGTLSYGQANAAFAAANAAGILANSAYAATNTADQRAVTSGSFANGAFAVANSSSSYANGAFASSNTKLSLTGGTITGNLTITSNTSAGNLAVSNTITVNDIKVSNTLNVHGVIVDWHEPVPTTSRGSPGDKAGYIAIDNDKLYRCVEDYTGGANNIWTFVSLTGGTWG